MKIKMVAHFEVQASGKVNGRDHVERIVRLIELIAFNLLSVISIDRPCFRGPVKTRDGINDFAIFSLAEREMRWRKAIGIYF